MPNNIVDVSTFTDPVVAPADGDALDAASIVPNGLQALANRTRLLVNRTTGVVGAGEFAYDAVKVRTRIIPAAACQPTDAQIADVPGWYFQLGRQFRTTANFARLVVPLGAWLPDGCTFRRIRALVAPGIARAGTNRMELIVTRITSINFGDPVGSPPVYTEIANVFDNAGVAKQVISSGFVTEVLAKSTGALSLHAQIVSGNDSATNTDTVEAFEIQYEDPGPQNF